MYSSVSDLPKGLKNNLPVRAQQLYLKHYRKAYQAYSDMSDKHSAAHRQGWAAVRAAYERGKTGWKEKQ